VDLGDAQIVTLREIIKLVHTKVRHIYFAMIFRTSFQLLELDRVGINVHVGLVFVPFVACIGLIIGFMTSICNFLSVIVAR